jgi:hypothetical protein
MRWGHLLGARQQVEGLRSTIGKFKVVTGWLEQLSGSPGAKGATSEK